MTQIPLIHLEKLVGLVRPGSSRHRLVYLNITCFRMILGYFQLKFDACAGIWNLGFRFSAGLRPWLSEQ